MTACANAELVAKIRQQRRTTTTTTNNEQAKASIKQTNAYLQQPRTACEDSWALAVDLAYLS